MLRPLYGDMSACWRCPEHVNMQSIKVCFKSSKKPGVAIWRRCHLAAVRFELAASGLDSKQRMARHDNTLQFDNQNMECVVGLRGLASGLDDLASAAAFFSHGEFYIQRCQLRDKMFYLDQGGGTHEEHLRVLKCACGCLLCGCGAAVWRRRGKSRLCLSPIPLACRPRAAATACASAASYQHPPTNHPPCRAAAEMSSKVTRAGSALAAEFPDAAASLTGLLQVGLALLEMLESALEAPPPRERPADALCLAVCSWVATLLAPTTALLRQLPQLSVAVGDQLLAEVLADVSRPLKKLIVRLSLQPTAPFAVTLREGAAKTKTLAAAMQGVLQVATEL